MEVFKAHVRVFVFYTLLFVLYSALTLSGSHYCLSIDCLSASSFHSLQTQKRDGCKSRNIKTL